MSRAEQALRLQRICCCIVSLLVFNAGLLLLQGCDGSGDPPQWRLPYDLAIQQDRFIVEDRVDLVDLDVDGNDDVVTWTPHHVSGTRIDNRQANLLEAYPDSGEGLLRVDLVAVHGADHQLLAIGKIRDGQSTSTIRYPQPDTTIWVPLSPVEEQSWAHLGGGKDTGSAVFPKVVIPQESIVLAFINTHHFPRMSKDDRSAPRKVVAYRWPEGNMLWEYPVAPLLHSWALRDLDGDGTPELFVGTRAAANGAVVDSTRDDECWVFCLSLDGEEISRSRVGGVFSRAAVLPCDIEGDNITDLIVGTRCSAPGQPVGALLRIDPLNGEELGRAPLEVAVNALYWMDDGIGSGDAPVIAVTHEGDALRVDADLSISGGLRSQSFEIGVTPAGFLSLGEGGTAALVIWSHSAMRVYDPRSWKQLGRLVLPGGGPYGGWIVRRGGRPSMLAVRWEKMFTVLEPVLKPWIVRFPVANPLVVPAVVVFIVMAILLRRRVRPIDRVRGRGAGTTRPQPGDADDIFNEALELTPSHRSSYLEMACGGRAALRREVESLLAVVDRLPGVAAESKPNISADRTHIGGYPVSSVLGRTQSSVVYRATDPKLKRDIAVKVLAQPAALDTLNRKRIEREAEILGSLGHQNIATVYSLEEHEGLFCITMEFVHGETLGERLKRGPLSILGSLSVGVQVAEALEAAHQQGVIHRDLKPANIMYGVQARVKILDFGIAKRVEAGHRDAQGGTLETAFAGTPGYMSPEQILGETVDQRTDMWAFGAVLYECLAGEPAFLAETIDRGVLTDSPDWGLLPKETPRTVVDVIKACLRKELTSRENSMSRVRSVLQKALESLLGR